MNERYTRIMLIHLASVTLLVVSAVALNVLVWSTTPDPFPDTLWNLLVMPSLRVTSFVGGLSTVLYGATSPVTLRLLRMHRRRKFSH